MSSNMQLWNIVKTVDEKYTKISTQGGRRETSITGLYPVMMMTKALGGMGRLWKFKIIEERFDNTQPIIIDGEALKAGDNIIWEQTHTIKMALLMRDDIKDSWEAVCEQFGHTKYRYLAGKAKGNPYIVVDEEAPKKSVTDAQKKCLSLMGVCADVFMGDFDDVNYKNQVQDELRVKAADEDSSKYNKEIESMREALADGVKAMGLCPTQRAALLVYNKQWQFFNNRVSSPKLSDLAQKAIQALDAEYQNAILKIKEKDDKK